MNGFLLFPVTIFSFFLSHAWADTTHFQYPYGYRNAISLTLDDARESQILVGLPILEKHNAKATFFVLPSNVRQQLNSWKEVARQGHEIGNHTYNHPCTGNLEWVQMSGINLEQSSLAGINQEILKATQFIQRELGVTPVSFAYPCGSHYVGRGVDTRSYAPLIAENFEFGRGWSDETGNIPTFTDFFQLAAISIDGRSFDEIYALLQTYREKNTWIILGGHEVGMRGPYSIDADALEQLLVYLKDPDNGFWFETLRSVGRYIKSHREEPCLSCKEARCSHQNECRI